MTALVSSCIPLPIENPGHLHNTVVVPARRPVPFPLPKKLGSDRLLLVSQALHEIPTYKSISPELTKQRKSLKPSSNHHERTTPTKRRVHFRAVDQVQEYEKEYDESDYCDLWFRPWEVDTIFSRDDDDFRVCFSSMAHTKRILQIWGMCSRGDSNTDTDAAVNTLFQQAPHPRARGLEHRIITGIRNHRQKAVQSFLQEQEINPDNICVRYLKFSQTAGRFAQALAEGDAGIAQRVQEEGEEGYEEDKNENEWGY